MTEPILDTSYWANRLKKAPADALHHAIFRCPTSRWLQIEEKHRKILAEEIGLYDKIIDVGCGWGRLLTLLPKDWRGAYLGVDISPDFIDLARSKWPGKTFVVGDIRNWERSWGIFEPIKFDWAIMISIRPMVIRNLGEKAWEEMEKELRKFSKQLLYLEYDPNDEGSIE